jgi:hypothetical protein
MRSTPAPIRRAQIVPRIFKNPAPELSQATSSIIAAFCFAVMIFFSSQRFAWRASLFLKLIKNI